MSSVDHIACRDCAGREAELIAPNYLECRAELSESEVVGQQPIIDVLLGPTGIPIGQHVVGYRPIWGTRRWTCGARQHVMTGGIAGGWPTCACGTFAIGLCARCGTPVCGDDSSRRGNLRLCRDCVTAVAAEEARVAAAASAAREVRTSKVKANLATRCRADPPHTRIAPDGHCWDCFPN